MADRFLAELKKRIPNLAEQERDLLRKRNYGNDSERDPDLLEDELRDATELLEDFRAMKSNATSPSVRSHPRSTPTDRQRARSKALWMLAVRNGRVQRFRAEHLRDGVIPLGDMARWLQAQSRRGLKPVPARLSVRVDGRESVRMLEVRLWETPWPVCYLPVDEGELLDELRCLSEELASTYGWQRAESATFVLTDAVPDAAAVSIEIEPNYRRPAGPRAIITVDLTAGPDAVRDAYAKARRAALATFRRSPNPKAYELAFFTLAGEHEEATWDLRRQCWNQIHPEWAYSVEQEPAFGRDCLDAVARLLEPGLTPWMAEIERALNGAAAELSRAINETVVDHLSLSPADTDQA